MRKKNIFGATVNFAASVTKYSIINNL